MATAARSEREQALNQLLVELDGFERDPGTVIVLAASNAVEKLDKALLRPGRFDRQVLVAPPDRDGREAILRSHARDKALADDIDLTDVARKTTGMTGAQLANALNEAAIIAGRDQRKEIAREHLDEALLRQSVGSQQARRLNEEERRIVAYHEAGHALARRLVGLDPPEILSIVPRGPALGFVAHSPQEDRYLRSRKQLLDEVVTLLGGRAAEEEVFDEAYSGAADDLARVHGICVQMVTEFGMTVAKGPPESAPAGAADQRLRAVRPDPPRRRPARPGAGAHGLRARPPADAAEPRVPGRPGRPTRSSAKRSPARTWTRSSTPTSCAGPCSRARAHRGRSWRTSCCAAAASAAAP